MATNTQFDVLVPLQDELMATAKSKGWYSSEVYNIAGDIANMHAETSELWEAYRKDQLTKPCDKSEAMLSSLGESLTCAEEECADLVIKALCIAKALNVDIAKAVRVKNAYNKTRPFRHGGKKA
jgi:NTP pyrophosphatase (non-canonical NTP hydrolase)